MKFGKTIQEMLKEVERQTETRKDYLAKTSDLSMVPTTDGKDVEVALKGNGTLRANDIAHDQIGEHVGIPAKYYDRMRHEAPELLARNVNHWFGTQDSKRMVRTLDGKMRAFLSNGFRPLENFDLVEAAVPVLIEKGMEIVSCDITERRLYIKAVDKSIQRDIPKGGGRMGDGGHTIFDTVSPACVISNSEVGMGSLSIEVGMLTKACTNLAFFKQRSMKKYHVGGRFDLGAHGVQELLSDQTKRLTDAAVWSQVKDVVANCFDALRFEESLVAIKAMTEQKIEGDPVKAIETTAKRFSFTDGERSSVLRHLIEGGDLTRYGIFNAVTRTAEDLGDYDRATEFERIGGEIVELTKSEWRVIAEAA